MNNLAHKISVTDSNDGMMSYLNDNMYELKQINCYL